MILNDQSEQQASDGGGLRIKNTMGTVQRYSIVDSFNSQLDLKNVQIDRDVNHLEESNKKLTI